MSSLGRKIGAKRWFEVIFCRHVFANAPASCLRQASLEDDQSAINPHSAQRQVWCPSFMAAETPGGHLLSEWGQELLDRFSSSFRVSAEKTFSIIEEGFIEP